MSIFRLSRTWSLLIVTLVAFLSGCSDTPTSTTPLDGPSFATDAYCALYPHICSPSGEDSSPSSPGYYGGDVITDQYCSGALGGINDVDQDLLADECETWLAIKFAPKMIYDSHDDVRRESYWAARPIQPGVVRVFYALGYYFDLGVVPETYGDCKLVTIQNLLANCFGHHGDSEYVVLDLRYNRSTKHWHLSSGKLSVHTHLLTLSTGSKGYPTAVAYPDKAGGHPQIFVARQKHSNYPSRQACNDGSGAPAPLNSLFPYDDCSSNSQSFRPEVNPLRNLGSNAHRRIDRVASIYPFYQDPVRYEHMWSASRFYGWQQDHTTFANGYGQLLRGQGF